MVVLETEVCNFIKKETLAQVFLRYGCQEKISLCQQFNILGKRPFDKSLI